MYKDMNKKLTVNNKPYIEEAFHRLNKNSLTEAPIGDFSKNTSLKHINQNSSDMFEYVRYALKNKQDENEDYSVAQYVLNNLKKDIEDNVRYWAKNRVDISKIKRDYEGCVALFNKYGTCPDKQLIMRKITNKINELFSEYKKNFDSKLEKLGERIKMNKKLTIDNRAYLQEAFNRLNEGTHRRYLKEALSDEDMYDFQADMESAIFRAAKRVIKNWNKYGLDSSDVENYLSDILEAAEEHILEEL